MNKITGMVFLLAAVAAAASRSASASVAANIRDAGSLLAMDVLQLESPTFKDAPVAVGSFPEAGMDQQQMGFYVTSAEWSEGVISFSWKTDMPGPYTVVYGDGSSNGLHVVTNVHEVGKCSVPWPVAAGSNPPECVHVQIGQDGFVPLLENESRLLDRAKMFHYSRLITKEYFYDTKFRLYSPKKGMSYLRNVGNVMSTIVFPTQKRFDCQVRGVKGGREVSFGNFVFDDPSASSMKVGVGYRVVLSVSGESCGISLGRAFSSCPNVSDAKIMRVTRH